MSTVGERIAEYQARAAIIAERSPFTQRDGWEFIAQLQNEADELSAFIDEIESNDAKPIEPVIVQIDGKTKIKFSTPDQMADWVAKIFEREPK